ncbi:integrin alpha [Methylocaldum sp. RMAD-M]|jgi:hypothetical protein|uniref:integrin alpha n=1 Tax=Methylocaldum sp. RMAD-M TaxID=2806557 RepID=UPI000A3221D8|nr:integrin alpha [Methylocaldum sp. RMAD-M]MBP1152832.1 hypothetical protein [Methylocaldum sp. RMAD-M]
MRYDDGKKTGRTAVRKRTFGTRSPATVLKGCCGLLAGFWLVSADAQPEYTPFTFKNPQPQPGASFGNDVATVGDVNGDGIPDFLVGVPGQNVLGRKDQGRAYVFSGANRKVLRTLNNPSPQSGALFGSVVAAAGDVNGDGIPDLLVGAHEQDVGGNVNQGRAFVFSGVNGSLLYTLDDPTGQADAHFGYALGSGDVDGDGRSDLLVGAPYQDVNGNADQGQVFVFSGNNGTLLRTLNNPTAPQAGSLFGSAVAGAGDLNSDGKVEILAAARLQNVGGNLRVGQAFVFNGDDGSLLHTLNTPTPQAYAWFGFAVGVGDVNDDSIPDFLVGAPLQDVGSNVNQGRVFVFSGADLTVTIIEHPIPQEDALFGEDLDEAGDVNGDGVPDLLVGAPRQDVNGKTNQGQAFALSALDGSLIVILDNPKPQRAGEFGNFGFSVDGAGDVNGDGVPDFLVGAREQNAGLFIDKGQAVLFVSTP